MLGYATPRTPKASTNRCQVEEKKNLLKEYQKIKKKRIEIHEFHNNFYQNSNFPSPEIISKI